MFIGRTDVWSRNSNILATWYKELTHWKRPWCWERLKVGWDGDGRGWDGWMASPAWWTWVWVNSGSWWWTGKPGVLQSMGSQRVGHDWVLNWTEEVEGRVGGDRTRSFFCFSLNSFSVLTTSTFQPSSEYRRLLLWKQFGKLFQLDCSGENAGQIPQEPGLERGKLSGV